MRVSPRASAALRARRPRSQGRTPTPISPLVRRLRMSARRAPARLWRRRTWAQPTPVSPLQGKNPESALALPTPRDFKPPDGRAPEIASFLTTRSSLLKARTLARRNRLVPRRSLFSLKARRAPVITPPPALGTPASEYRCRGRIAACRRAPLCPCQARRRGRRCPARP